MKDSRKIFGKEFFFQMKGLLAKTKTKTIRLGKSGRDNLSHTKINIIRSQKNLTDCANF